MIIGRRVSCLVAVSMLFACHAKHGDWEKSREQLCDQIESESHDVGDKLPTFEKELTDAPTEAESEYATWNDPSCDRKILVSRRRTELCTRAVRDVTEEAAEIRGLWKAATIVSAGRPDGTETIGMGLSDVDVRDISNVCDARSREDYDTRWKAGFASLRKSWTDHLSRATAECRAQGWQSKKS